MKRKINLEEILKSKISGVYIFENVSEEELTSFRKGVYSAMKEAVRQALELAAENSRTILANDKDGHSQVKVSKQSIINTINQIE